MAYINNERIRTKYRGYGINDFALYLLCRQRIASGFYGEHHESLKRYYRRAFLNNPFRKAK